MAIDIDSDMRYIKRSQGKSYFCGLVRTHYEGFLKLIIFIETIELIHTFIQIDLYFYEEYDLLAASTIV